jgi:hypothetical protein
MATLNSKDITIICPAHDRLGPPRFKTDNIFNVWLPKAMNSIIMFASLLMTASRALAELYPEERYSLYALHYKGMVLQLLRQGRLDSADKVSDETLAALVSIKWEEVRTAITTLMMSLTLLILIFWYQVWNRRHGRLQCS